MSGFGLGQRAFRVQDERPLTGNGCSVADQAIHQQAHALVLRSADADGEMVSIDARAARRGETDGTVLSAIARYDCAAPAFPNGYHIREVDPETGAFEIAARSSSMTAVPSSIRSCSRARSGGRITHGHRPGPDRPRCPRARVGAAAQQLVPRLLDPDGERGSADRGGFFRRALHHPPLLVGTPEAEAIAACPSRISALLVASAPVGVEDIDMPATPEAVWRVIEEAHCRPSAQPAP